MKLLPLNETSMNLILPSKLLQTVQSLKFEQAAELTGMALDDFYQLLVSRNILTPPTDPDDEPKELILTSLCISLQQAKEGKVHPISELWDGIDD